MGGQISPHSWPYDDAERKKWQSPKAILIDIGLKPGDTFIDLGCAEGFFAIPAAKLVGKKGKVYGLDINEGFIKILRKNARRQNLRNIIAEVGAAEDTILCDRCADIVFFGIDLHDFEDPHRVLLNAKKMLKPTGKLVDLDWKKEPMDLGPPLEIRFSQEDAVRRIKRAGFTLEVSKEMGPYHYLIIARP